MSDQLLYGWNPLLDVPSALERLAGAELADLVALVSVIDSTPNVADMPSLVPHLRRTGRSYTVADRDVAVRLPALIELIDQDFFFGFEEIWLYSAVPRQGKPAGVRITSDLHLTALPAGLSEWMSGSGCLAGLGDGDGLNFATFDEHLAELWKG